jgi:hypothetical protein
MATDFTSNQGVSTMHAFELSISRDHIIEVWREDHYAEVVIPEVYAVEPETGDHFRYIGPAPMDSESDALALIDMIRRWEEKTGSTFNPVGRVHWKRA